MLILYVAFQAVAKHDDVFEEAVIGVKDEVKGLIPVGLIVLSKSKMLLFFKHWSMNFAHAVVWRLFLPQVQVEFDTSLAFHYLLVF